VWSRLRTNQARRHCSRMSQIADRARALARTGDFANWSFIEQRLRQEGLGEAFRVLGSPALREELDRLCREARSRPPAQHPLE